MLAAALTPAPRLALQWSADGLTAALLESGAGLVVVTDANKIWVRSCCHDPALAPARAAGRLLFVRGQSPPDFRFYAAGTARDVLAQRRAWPDLLVLSEPFLAAALADLHAASASLGACPMPRLLLTSDGAPPAEPAPGWRTVQAAGRFRLLDPTGAAKPAPPARTRREAPRFGGLRMSKPEAAMFRDSVSRVRSCYLEWGLGGSTLEALARGAPRVVSVESDPAWAAIARTDPRIAAAEESGRLTILTPDLGPVGPWGTPRDADRVASSWRDYVVAPLRAALAAGHPPDVVLVDGRFRTACCLAVADLCLAGDIEPPLLLLHDADRPDYAPVLLAWDKVGASGSLWLMRLRAELDAAAVRAGLERFGPQTR